MRRFKNSVAVAPDAVKGMTKPEMTKKISTPTQPKSDTKWSEGNANGSPTSGRVAEKIAK
jgi:hypothetical protein